MESPAPCTMLLDLCRAISGAWEAFLVGLIFEGCLPGSEWDLEEVLLAVLAGPCRERERDHGAVNMIGVKRLVDADFVTI